MTRDEIEKLLEVDRESLASTFAFVGDSIPPDECVRRGYNSLAPLLADALEALQVVIERHKTYGNDARKNGVSYGLNHVCEKTFNKILKELGDGNS